MGENAIKENVEILVLCFRLHTTVHVWLILAQDTDLVWKCQFTLNYHATDMHEYLTQHILLTRSHPVVF